MMACSRNENCRNIAYDYQNTLDEVKNDYVVLYKKLSEVDDNLSKQIIPEDYLGGKIKNKLKQLKLTYDDNVEDILKVENKMVSFIRNKRYEHQKHYEEWLAMQEAKRKKEETAEKQ